MLPLYTWKLTHGILPAQFCHSFKCLLIDMFGVFNTILFNVIKKFWTILQKFCLEVTEINMSWVYSYLMWHCCTISKFLSSAEMIYLRAALLIAATTVYILQFAGKVHTDISPVKLCWHVFPLDIKKDWAIICLWLF